MLLRAIGLVVVSPLILAIGVAVALFFLTAGVLHLARLCILAAIGRAFPL